jgi:cytochrome c
MKRGKSVLAMTCMLGILVSTAAVSTAAHGAIDDAQAKALMKKGGCGACHSVKSKVVGPAYKDVAEKHRTQPDAVAALEKAVRAGSKGSYGPVPMPATLADRISDPELHDLIEWILTK